MFEKLSSIKIKQLETAAFYFAMVSTEHIKYSSRQPLGGSLAKNRRLSGFDVNFSSYMLFFCIFVWRHLFN